MSSTLPIGSTTHTSGSNSVTGTGSSSSSSGSSGSNSSSNIVPANMQISEAGFLQLISTQLQNQDPLNPTDPSQFLSQVEGLSEVSSLQNLQTSIAGLATGLQGSQMLSSTSLLGHTVLVPSTTANLASGGTVSGAVTAPTGATTLNVAVTNSAGSLIDSFQVAAQSSGLTPFSWNGESSSGSAAAAGQYTIGVTTNVGGTPQTVNPNIYSTVQSVTMDPTTQALDLNTNNGTVPLSSVVTIK
jgi:flagellar basal-body rod modification protein FlgD